MKLHLKGERKMKIKLQKLEIKNFKKVKEFKWEFDGKNWIIRGDNGVGKSTIYDAYTWLLFGKDSKDSADFNIRTVDQTTKEIIHNTDIEVYAELMTDDGLLKLQRISREKWTKKRGSATMELDGNETSYYINEVPAKESEWKKKIASLCGDLNEKTFKSLSSLGAFNKLDKKEKRQILFGLISDVSDGAIAHSVEFELQAKTLALGDEQVIEEFKNQIDNVGFENSRKIFKDRCSKLNDDLKTIPVRINEVFTQIEKVEDSESDLKAALEEIDDKINQVSAEKASNSSSTLVAEIQKEINDLQMAKQKKINDTYLKQDAMRAELQKMSKELASIQESRRIDNDAIARAKNTINEYMSEYKEITNRTFESGVCPVCHRELPEEMVEEARKEFDAKKEKDLQENITKGKGYRAKIQAIENSIKEHDEKALELNKKYSLLNKELQDVKFDTSEEDAKIQELTQKKAEALSGVDNSAYEEKMQMLSQTKNQLLKKLVAKDNEAKANARIKELEEQIQKAEKEHAKNTTLLALSDKLLEIKVNKVTDVINSKFKITSWELFNKLLNGGYEEVCIPTIMGVDYASLNSAMQKNVDLDIINTLQKEFKVECPVWIDNAESCNEYLPIDAQTIKLYVTTQEVKCVEMVEE